MLGLGPAVQIHLAKGAAANGRDEKGQTPLILAASRGHCAVCAMLLAAGADPDLTDDAGIDALQAAIRSERQDVIELLRRQLHEEQEPAGRIPEPRGEFDLSGWQPEIVPEPPDADLTVLADVQAIHAAFSMHVPIDLDEDWSDVEIDLPALLPRRARRNSEAEARWFAEARKVLAIGLRNGTLTESLIEEMGAIDGLGEHDLPNEAPALLRIVVGDLGIRIDDTGPVDETPPVDEELEGEFETALDEAVDFLRCLMRPGSDPLHPYFKTLSRAKRLSREEEREVAVAMERGMLRALTAATHCSPAMMQLLAILQDIEAGTAVWRNFIADDPAYGEHPLKGSAPPDQDDVEQDGTDDEPDPEVTMPAIPPLLAERLNIVRALCARLCRPSDNADAPRSDLAACLFALGLRPETFERLDGSIRREGDPGIRDEFAAGIEEARKARPQLFHANQRLVLWIARKYRGLPLSDLVQEGNLGLLKAIDRFDPKRGNKLSTYAMWSVRQAITRAIDDQGQLIRIPVQLAALLRKLTRISETYEKQFGRTPTATELSKNLALEERRVARALSCLAMRIEPLETGTNSEGVAATDLADESNPNPEQIAAANSLAQAVRARLASLPEREKTIISLRFGVGMETDHTLEEVGRMYGVTRERIRQIEAKAFHSLERRTHSLQGLL